MSVEKTLARMVMNPKSDWTLEDVSAVAGHYGLHHSSATGSHYQFFKDKPKDFVTVSTVNGRQLSAISARSFLVYLLNHAPEAVTDCQKHLRHDKHALKQLEQMASGAAPALR